MVIHVYKYVYTHTYMNACIDTSLWFDKSQIALKFADILVIYIYIYIYTRALCGLTRIALKFAV